MRPNVAEPIVVRKPSGQKYPQNNDSARMLSFSMRHPTKLRLMTEPSNSRTHTHEFKAFSYKYKL